MRILRLRRTKRKTEKLSGLNCFALLQTLRPITEKSNKPIPLRSTCCFFYAILYETFAPPERLTVLRNKYQSNDERERATVPARIKTSPISALTVNFSFSAKKENAIVTKIPSLSTDTTTETTPSFNAL